MGWQDRDYGSEEGYARATGRRSTLFPAHWRVSTALVIANVALFLMAPPPRGRVFDALVLDAPSVLGGELWRLLSACFLHWSTTHLLFNMIALYFFGAVLEQALGRRRFLALYLGAGVLASAIYALLYVVGWSSADGLAAGASGCVYAILGACAILTPQLRVLVFFVLPMGIRTFLALFVVWGLINVFSGGPNAGGDAVHLAGLAVGLGYAAKLRRDRAPRTPAAAAAAAAAPAPASAPPRARARARSRSLEEEVDLILAKIHREGMDSLDERERAVLAEASRRRAQR